MTSQDDQQAKLDAALKAALEELDDDDDSALESENNNRAPPTVSSKQQAIPMGPPRPPTTNSDDSSEKILADMMRQMMAGVPPEDGSGPEAEEFLSQIMQEVSLQLQTEMTTATAETTQQWSAGDPSLLSDRTQKAKSPTDLIEDEKVKKAISNLVAGMGKHTKLDNEEDNSDSDVPEDFLNGIMKGLADLGPDGDFNADSMIDGMMEHLLAKDIMYEPMKQVTVKFPDWLRERRDTLPPDEYAEREKQYQCFCSLVQVYETEPNNVAKLMELMQQVQEFGQPPPEIIKEIAPGVELDEEGLPKLDATGIPMNGEECCLM